MNTTLNSVLAPPEFDNNWHMQASERVALLQALHSMKPQVSVEIGTFLRGSLRPIARASEYVYTFDIDANQHRNQDEFDNVRFVTGDTRTTLRPIIQEINDSRKRLGFILVDGSHEEDGVTYDINACLEYTPKNGPTVILMHDSANPDVRRGIMKANWYESPYVHCVNLDFVPGMLYDRPDISGQIWGGLAAAVLLPIPRVGALTIDAPFQPSLNVLIANSVYAKRDHEHNDK